MKFKLLAIFSGILFSNVVLANAKTTVEDYIEQWKEIAIRQMHSHKIPASITMAQGILESSFGNSELAVKANNHFGIKCHGWEGDKIYKDDDAKNECFRKYPSAEMSFEDHSLFLTSRPRYGSLFQLEITDYTGWANGLKAAGYATNPKYAKRLIDLIERYNLDALDHQDFIPNTELIAEKSLTETTKENPILASNNSNANVKRREVVTNTNRTKYVLAREGDTFYQLSRELGMTLRQLHKYNDFPPNKDHLVEGDIVYITPKRNRSKKSLNKVKLDSDSEIWELSQAYGLKLRNLMQINAISSPTFALQKGEVIHLR